MQMAESAIDSSSLPATSRDTSNWYDVIKVMRKMSVTPPAQKAISRPAWHNDNMHKKKKQGWRPPSKRFHASRISESSIARVKTAAALLVSQPMRKHSAAAAVAQRYPSSSSAAATWKDAVAPVGPGLKSVFIIYR